MLAGIERMHRIRKEQFAIEGIRAMSCGTNFMRW
jgi:hypothetical protein